MGSAGPEGGIVSSLISSEGTAAVGIGMDVWRGAVDAITPVATNVVGGIIEALFPGLAKGLFSGRWLADLFGQAIKGGLAARLGTCSADWPVWRRSIPAVSHTARP